MSKSGLALSVVAVVVVLCFWLRGAESAHVQPRRITPQLLQFRAQSDGDAVALTWTPVEAERAILTIRDGGQEENVPLDAAWLRSGHARYQPISSAVGFRLTVSGDRTVSEGTAVEVLAQAKIEPLPALPAVQQPEPVPAAFTPPPAVEAARAAELPEPPALSGGAVSFGAGPALRQRELARPPQVQVKPTGSGKVSEPVLLHEARPVYPQLALAHHVEGAVGMKLLIDTAGRVSRAEVLDGPPVLRQAALDAVRQWRYRPASLDGEAVTMAVKVAVQFRANR